MDEQIQTKLRVSREKAEKKILEQIKKGKHLCDLQIHTENMLENTVTEGLRWSKYNETLLSKFFDNMTVANEYKKFTDPPRSVNYYVSGYVSVEDLPLQKIIASCRKRLEDSIDSLDGIYERLELYDELMPKVPYTSGNEIFIVHGRDDGAKETVARFVEKISLKVTILHEQPTGGSRTIIEKLEKYADNAGFAVVLLTPDDVGSLKDTIEHGSKPRARQNVVFELGYFMGKLGRERVCPLFKGDIENPSDIDGVVYVSMDNEDWKLKLGQEMKNAGFPVDMNKIY